MSDKAMEALRMRLAKGEIDIEEYSALEARLTAKPAGATSWLDAHPSIRPICAIALVALAIVMTLQLFTVRQWNLVTMFLLAGIAAGSFWGALVTIGGRVKDSDDCDKDAT